VSVGADHGTSAFAVETLRRWWSTVGAHRYPGSDQLLICADGGGSNGYRVRAWKIELARLAAETDLTITVCHLPAVEPVVVAVTSRPSSAGIGCRCRPTRPVAPPTVRIALAPEVVVAFRRRPAAG